MKCTPFQIGHVMFAGYNTLYTYTLYTSSACPGLTCVLDWICDDLFIYLFSSPASADEYLKVFSCSMSRWSSQKRKGRTHACCSASVWTPGLDTWHPLTAWRQHAGITATLCRSARRSKGRPILRYFILTAAHAQKHTNENEMVTLSTKMIYQVMTRFNRIEWEQLWVLLKLV